MSVSVVCLITSSFHSRAGQPKRTNLTPALLMRTSLTNKAIYEFIQTESTYNRDLQLIVQVFYASLLDTLDEKAQTVIFANVEDILLANTAFLSDLEERQRETRLYVDRVGDVVREHMGNMDVYTVSSVAAG